MTKVISYTKARKTLADVLDNVAKGDDYIITRANHKPVVMMDLEKFSELDKARLDKKGKKK